MWVALGGVLLQIAGSLVGRVLLAMGIGYVTYKGVDVSTTYLVNMVKDSIAGLPAEIIDFLAFCWVDKGLSLIFSTWTSCIAFSGIGAGLTKMRMKGA